MKNRIRSTYAVIYRVDDGTYDIEQSGFPNEKEARWWWRENYGYSITKLTCAQIVKIPEIDVRIVNRKKK